MMRETKERERERKRESARKGKIKKPKNQKIPSSAAFSSSNVFCTCSCSFAHTRATQTDQREKMGEKGTPASSSKTAKKKKQSSGAAAKTPSLPNKVSRDSYFFSFLFSLTTLSSSGCVAFWKSLIFRPPERIIIIIVFRNAVSYFNIIG
jgi:hypothetical protein